MSKRMCISHPDNFPSSRALQVERKKGGRVRFKSLIDERL